MQQIYTSLSCSRTLTLFERDYHRTTTNGSRILWSHRLTTICLTKLDLSSTIVWYLKDQPFTTSHLGSRREAILSTCPLVWSVKFEFTLSVQKFLVCLIDMPISSEVFSTPLPSYEVVLSIVFASVLLAFGRFCLRFETHSYNSDAPLQCIEKCR